MSPNRRDIGTCIGGLAAAVGTQEIRAPSGGRFAYPSVDPRTTEYTLGPGANLGVSENAEIRGLTRVLKELRG
jgi:hypothetical protein